MASPALSSHTCHCQAKSIATPCARLPSSRICVSGRNNRPARVNASHQQPSLTHVLDTELDHKHVLVDSTSITRRQSILFTAAAWSISTLLLTRPSSALPAAGPRLLTGDAKAAVNAALRKVIVKSKAPVVLRMVFHDAGTYDMNVGDGGLNASVRLELSRPENFGLKRGWNLVEQIQKELKGTAAEGQVSLADTVALAGAYAVSLTGGPLMEVPVGRADADTPDPEGRLPSEISSPNQLKASFAAKGLDVREMIVLSGAHTLGSKGFGDPVTFDNNYFVTLMNKTWLKETGEMRDHIGLPSDRSLPDDPECLAIIQEYAADQAAFFNDFSKAYLKLVSSGVSWA